MEPQLASPLNRGSRVPAQPVPEVRKSPCEVLLAGVQTLNSCRCPAEALGCHPDPGTGGTV